MLIEKVGVEMQTAREGRLAGGELSTASNSVTEPAVHVRGPLL